MAVRLSLLKCYVWSTLLYGAEAWTLSSVMMKKLEAFETWLYRKMLRISWKHRITNDEVYHRMGTVKALMGNIVRRQLSCMCAYSGRTVEWCLEWSLLHGELSLVVDGTIQEHDIVPTTAACTWWNRPEEDLSSGKLESTHSSRTVVKSINVIYGVESVVRGDYDPLLLLLSLAGDVHQNPGPPWYPCSVFLQNVTSQ